VSRKLKPGDLVRLDVCDYPRDQAGLGIVISERNRIVGGYRYKVLWSNNYGTFWSPRNKLELLNEDW
jgi:hypothetical protein